MNDIIRGTIPADVARPYPCYLRDFQSVAPDAYLQYNAALRTWEVMKDLVTADQDEHGVVRKTTVPTVRAVFQEIDQRAIDNLRYRRWVGLRLQGNPQAYFRWLMQEHEEAKAKEKELARDMMAEGFMRAWKYGHQHTVNLGGHHGSISSVDGGAGLRSE